MKPRLSYAAIESHLDKLLIDLNLKNDDALRGKLLEVVSSLVIKKITHKRVITLKRRLLAEHLRNLPNKLEANQAQS